MSGSKRMFKFLKLVFHKPAQPQEEDNKPFVVYDYQQIGMPKVETTLLDSLEKPIANGTVNSYKVDMGKE